MMLSPDELRVAIARQIDGSRSIGVIRGLLWALTGADPGDQVDAAEVLRLAGIPHATKGDKYMIDPAWQVGHGLEPELAPWLLQEWGEVSGLDLA